MHEKAATYKHVYTGIYSALKGGWGLHLKPQLCIHPNITISLPPLLHHHSSPQLNRCFVKFLPYTHFPQSPPLSPVSLCPFPQVSAPVYPVWSHTLPNTFLLLSLKAETLSPLRLNPSTVVPLHSEMLSWVPKEDVWFLRTASWVHSLPAAQRFNPCVFRLLLVWAWEMLCVGCLRQQSWLCPPLSALSRPHRFSSWTSALVACVSLKVMLPL